MYTLSLRLACQNETVCGVQGALTADVAVGVVFGAVTALMLSCLVPWVAHISRPFLGVRTSNYTQSLTVPHTSQRPCRHDYLPICFRLQSLPTRFYMQVFCQVKGVYANRLTDHNLIACQRVTTACQYRTTLSWLCPWRLCLLVTNHMSMAV